MTLYHDDTNLELNRRKTVAWESIAKSLEKLANPPLTAEQIERNINSGLNPDARY